MLTNYKPTILILSFSNLNSDPRVYRQITFLKDLYHVHTIGFTPSGITDIVHLNLSTKPKKILQRAISVLQLLAGTFSSYYKNIDYIQQAKEYLSENHFDLIIANDIDTLPLAIEHKKNAKVLFDAHEYSPRELEDKLLWRLFYQRYKIHLCKKYIAKVDKMTTVCDGIAQEYFSNFGIFPSVITNAPMYEPTLKPFPSNPSKIKIIHHGGASESRKIELMIEAMKYVDTRFDLYLMLVTSQPHYYKKLRTMSEGMKNIHFLEPVPMQNIAKITNQFDIGLFILEPVNFNYQYALPNKLFEFIQARLCIAIGPSIEMAKIVRNYHLGIVTESFNPQEMASALNALTNEDISSFKSHCDQAAYELSAEKNRLLLTNIIQQMLEMP